MISLDLRSLCDKVEGHNAVQITQDFGHLEKLPQNKDFSNYSKILIHILKDSLHIDTRVSVKWAI